MKIKKIHSTNKFYQKLMLFGKISGCHQLLERSFFIHSKQFPVCARCTGVVLGNIIAVIIFFLFLPNWLWFVMGCTIMFMDWLIQYLGILESTNIRRFITGIIGGYSLTSLYGLIINFIFQYFL